MQMAVMNTTKEKLVVEVVGAHNLIPKDGEGSSSPFVEVEFNGQTLKTEVKHKELNPIWNEKLLFNVGDVGDLPYRSIEVSVFNEKKSNSSRHFLGKVRVSGTSVAREGEAVVQHFVLDKRTLFSNVRGEISLKLYVSSVAEVKEVVDGSKVIKNGAAKTMSFRKNKKGGNKVVMMQQKQQQQQQLLIGGGGGGGGNNNNLMNGLQNQNNAKQMNPILGNMKPVVITNNSGPIVPAGGGGGMILGGGGRMGGGAFPSGQNDYSLKETRPDLGGGPLNKDKTSSTYDLVEQVQYLYVRIVKAREISNFGVNEVIAEVKLGNYRGVAKRVPSNNAEWDQVFAFSKDNIQSSFVEVFVKESNKDEFLGRALFDLNEVPKRMQPDSQLAPHWCRMEDKKGDKVKGGEIMVAIWFGTQADEAFAEAWHSKAANVHLDGLSSIKSKVYLSPKLWYLRVGVIEAQDVVSGDKGSAIMRYPELLAKIQVGNQVLKTRIASPTANRSLSNPFWNEDLMFVVAEPFEDYLSVSVEDRIGPNREEVVGRLLLPLTNIERRLDEKAVASRWYNLDVHFGNANDQKSGVRFASRIHIRASLDGGYHVLDEATMYSSDVRPTAKQLWKPHIGVLEVGVLGASNLIPMKIKEGKGGTTDAYCVAKYGQKWVRTRTIVDSLAPRWNEQYTWEVFDPCTVITIGVFDNSLVGKNSGLSMGNRDTRIGKVRIRLSTLETDKVYTHAYPLLMLHPSGVKKTGELHLAVRFTCANLANMMHMYTQPFLPKMHYTQPLSINQLEALRYQATNVIATRLSRAEPPLGREVVEYMLDHDTHMWSMRKSKANFFRLTSVLSWIFVMSRFLETMRSWNQPVYSTSFLIVFLILVLAPEIIIPCVLLTISVVGLCRYRSRPRQPPHMDTKLSCTETILSDELDEEFDSFPTSRNPDTVRIRYDRLRSVARRIQTVVGDMATQGERFQALLSWRDPRATFLFIIFCTFAAFVFYLIPVAWIVALWGMYYLRPPKFRSKLPSPTLCFLKRLPTKADSML